MSIGLPIYEEGENMEVRRLPAAKRRKREKKRWSRLGCCCLCIYASTRQRDRERDHIHPSSFVCKMRVNVNSEVQSAASRAP